MLSREISLNGKAVLVLSVFEILKTSFSGLDGLSLNFCRNMIDVRVQGPILS